MREERGHWYLLTGFVIGIVLGLVYAWLIDPRNPQFNSPASLQPEFKDQFRAMIASAFVATGNLPRAEARLDYLGDPDITRLLAEQAQRTLAEGESPLEAQALGLLAVAIGQGDSAVIASSSPPSPPGQNRTPESIGSPVTPASSETPLPDSTTTEAAAPSPAPTNADQGETNPSSTTATPLPTRTPTATPGSPFVLQSNTFICDPDLLNPSIQVIAENPSGDPLPGQEINVTWEAGDDRFFTGLKPEISPGYADFLMEPGIVYQVSMAAGGQSVPDITAAECELEDGSRYWGSWQLVFSRP